MKKLKISDYMKFNDEKFNRCVVFSGDLTTTILLNFRPGQTLPAHNHPGSSLQLIVLEGEGVFTFDETEVPAKKGDLFFVDGDETISFINNSTDNVSIYAILTKKD